MKRIVIVLLFIGSFVYAREWKQIALVSSPTGIPYFASSWLSHDDDDDDDYFNYVDRRYGFVNLLDGNLETAWVPHNENSGIGETVHFGLPDNPRTINIYNGYGKSQSLFERNNRVKEIKLSYYLGVHPDGGFVAEVATIYLALKFPEDFTIYLDDSPGLQTFTLPLDNDALNEFKHQAIADFYDGHDLEILYTRFIIELEIVDIYKGSRWDDTCISEIFFSNTYVADSRLFVNDRIEKIYTDEANPGRVLVELSDNKPVAIIEDDNYIFDIMEVSPDKKWVTATKMPAEIGVGRVETQWLIINPFLGKVMNEEIEKTYGGEIFGPFFFSEHNNITVLELDDEKIFLK